MTISRLAALGLVCLFAGACTAVVQPAANQPRPAPSTTERDADVVDSDAEPNRRPPVQVPRTRPSNPEPDPRYDEPQTPTRRPSPRSNRLNLGVPPGHLPGPGECRVWVQGLASGQQARSRPCSGILATAPVGSWILYRPARYQRQVRVRYLHETRQMVIAVRAFDVETGAYLRDFALEEDDNNMAPTAASARRQMVRSDTVIGWDDAATGKQRGHEPESPPLERNSVEIASPNFEEHAILGIHPRFLPNPGMCRIWVHNLPYGRQARAASCDDVASEAPAGALILRRTTDEPNVVWVDYVHEADAGVIVRTVAFSVVTGEAIRETR